MPELDQVDDVSVIIELPDAGGRPSIGARSVPGDEDETGLRRREVDRRPTPRAGQGKVPVDVQRKIDLAVRQRRDAERIADAALDRAKRAEGQLAAGRGAALDTELTNAKARHEEAKKRHKAALDNGDTEAATQAASDMSEAAATMEAARRVKASLPPEPAGGQDDGQQQRPQVSAPVQSWMDKNPWFSDPEHADLHDAAVGIHNVLKAQGITPKHKDYFRRIDEEMAAKFPEVKELRVDYPEEDDEPEEGVEDLDERRPAQAARPQPNNERNLVRGDGKRNGPLKIQVDELEASIAGTMDVDPHVWGLHKAFRQNKITQAQLSAELNRYRKQKNAK